MSPPRPRRAREVYKRQGLVSPYLAMVFGRVPYVIGKDAMYLMVVIVAFIAVVLLTS